MVCLATFIAIAAAPAIARAGDVSFPALDWTVDMDGTWTVTEGKVHLETLEVTLDGGKTHGLYYVDRRTSDCAAGFATQAKVASIGGGWLVETPKYASPWYPAAVERMSNVPDEDHSQIRIWFCRNLKHGSLEVEGPAENDEGLAVLAMLLESLDDVATQDGNPKPRYRDSVAALRAKYPKLTRRAAPAPMPAQ